ncbi:hypothetical protein EIP86_002286 [Pleurotus ostreatoroseus]|nr:hypothetical protein EIP86_002286 [Pleurotus ostreatoroseus]
MEFTNAVVGVQAALAGSAKDSVPTPQLFTHDFSLKDRVALVTGAYGGLGLETALAFVEAGARAVYCVGRSPEPPENWRKVRDYAARMEGKAGEGRLEYVRADATDRDKMMQIAEDIGNKEGRLDICVAAHGTRADPTDCLDLTPDVYHRVLEVNTAGALYAAQAAGKQMVRFENGGSIVLLSSMAGSVALRNVQQVAYSASKAAMIQMARSMAIELGPKRIRVNSLSPGFMYTGMTAAHLDAFPDAWSDENPLGRTAKAHEIRGVMTWLASDASTFCTGSE